MAPLRLVLAKILLPLRLERGFLSRPAAAVAVVTERLGSSSYSVRMDRAGPHRRLAIAMPPLAIALVAMAVTNVLAGAIAPAQWFPHLVLAASVLWTLQAMLDSGRLVDAQGTPHVGLFAVGASLLGWAAIRFGAATPICCSASFVMVGVGCMSGAAVLFAGAERQSLRPAMLGGRLLLSVGALVLGTALLVSVSVALASDATGNAGHLLAVTMLGSACLLLAVAEARLLLRLVGYAISRGRVR